MKPTLIAFEGIDKVGKSAIREFVRKDLNFGPLPMDRFLASNFAYDCYYNRKHYIRNYKEMEESLLKSFDVVLVYLVCRKKELVERLKIENPKITAWEFEDIITPDIYFAAYFYYSQFRKIVIDTSNLKINDAARIVKNFVISGESFNAYLLNPEWAKMIKASSEKFLKADTLSIFNGEGKVFNGEVDWR